MSRRNGPLKYEGIKARWMENGDRRSWEMEVASGKAVLGRRTNIERNEIDEDARKGNEEKKYGILRDGTRIEVAKRFQRRRVRLECSLELTPNNVIVYY